MTEECITFDEAPIIPCDIFRVALGKVDLFNSHDLLGVIMDGFVDGPKAACAEFLKECIRAGGVVAGKHKMLLLHGLLNRGMRGSGITRASFLKH